MAQCVYIYRNTCSHNIKPLSQPTMMNNDIYIYIHNYTYIYYNMHTAVQTCNQHTSMTTKQ